MFELDDKDQGLLSILRSDSRTPVVEIAKKLSVTRATVINRIKRLETNGVIVGYTLVLGSEVENRDIRALMNIAVESHQEARIIKSLHGQPNVAAIYHTTGQWDLIIDIQTSSLATLNRLIGAFRQIEGIKTTETNLLLDQV